MCLYTSQVLLNLLLISKTEVEVSEVAYRQIFAAIDFGLLSTPQMAQMQYALKSDDFH